MGLKITTLSQELTMEHSVKLEKFEHAYELLTLIGHGVILEGSRKMTGCLQTSGGQCIAMLLQSE